MAITVDFGASINTDPELGIYGIYNTFLCKVTTSNLARFKTSYRFRITVGSLQYEFDAEPNNDTSKLLWVNPVEDLQTRFFSSYFFANQSDIDEATYTNRLADVQIEIGEVSAAAADEPATFLGYETDNTFRFFNGFNRKDLRYREANYRNPDTAFAVGDLPLPMVIKNQRWMKGLDVDVPFSVYNRIKGDYDGLGAAEYDFGRIEIKTYDADDVLIATNTISSGPLPVVMVKTTDIAGTLFTPYWTAATVRAEVRGYYSKTGVNDFIYPTEVINYTVQECSPKYDNWQVYFVNSLGGNSVMNFTGRSYRFEGVERGKKITESGIDYEADEFSFLTEVRASTNRQTAIRVGTRLRLLTDYLTQDEMDAYEDFIASPYFYAQIVGSSGKSFQVFLNLLDSQIEIKKVGNELAQIAVNFEVAEVEPVLIN